MTEEEKQKLKSQCQSIASLSPGLAWRLLTQAEQQFVVDYLLKVLDKEGYRKDGQK